MLRKNLFFAFLTIYWAVAANGQLKSADECESGFETLGEAAIQESLAACLLGIQDACCSGIDSIFSVGSASPVASCLCNDMVLEEVMATIEANPIAASFGLDRSRIMSFLETCNAHIPGSPQCPAPTTFQQGEETIPVVSVEDNTGETGESGGTDISISLSESEGTSVSTSVRTSVSTTQSAGFMEVKESPCSTVHASAVSVVNSGAGNVEFSTSTTEGGNCQEKGIPVVENQPEKKVVEASEVINIEKEDADINEDTEVKAAPEPLPPSPTNSVSLHTGVVDDQPEKEAVKVMEVSSVQNEDAVAPEDTPTQPASVPLPPLPDSISLGEGVVEIQPEKKVVEVVEASGVQIKDAALPEDTQTQPVSVPLPPLAANVGFDVGLVKVPSESVYVEKTQYKPSATKKVSTKSTASEKQAPPPVVISWQEPTEKKEAIPKDKVGGRKEGNIRSQEQGNVKPEWPLLKGGKIKDLMKSKLSLLG